MREAVGDRGVFYSEAPACSLDFQIRSRTAFTNAGLFSVPNSFASSTASLIAFPPGVPTVLDLMKCEAEDVAVDHRLPVGGPVGGTGLDLQVEDLSLRPDIKGQGLTTHSSLVGVRTVGK